MFLALMEDFSFFHIDLLKEVGRFQILFDGPMLNDAEKVPRRKL